MYSIICNRYKQRDELHSQLYNNIQYNGCYELKETLERHIDQLTAEIILLFQILQNNTQENTKEIEFESSVIIG